MNREYETAIADFGSFPSRLDPQSQQSWQQMRQIEQIAKETGTDFASAFVEFQHQLAVGLPVPSVAALSQDHQPTVTLSFGEFGEIDTTNLAEDQRSAIAEINSIARQENLTFEEATRRFVERHPERY